MHFRLWGKAANLRTVQDEVSVVDKLSREEMGSRGSRCSI